MVAMSCRCHTFGIGSSICESLVTSIAEASGGRSVILPEGDRLQTKVCMCVTRRYLGVSHACTCAVPDVVT